MKQEIQNKIDQLKAQISELEAELNKPEKWQPKGGEWYIGIDGTVNNGLTVKQYAAFGIERDDNLVAENAAKAMRAFNRLLAYRDEFFPEWEEYTGDLYYVARRDDTNEFKYFLTYTDANHFDGRVLFSDSVVLDLIRKLNSGEVEL